MDKDKNAKGSNGSRPPHSTLTGNKQWTIRDIDISLLLGCSFIGSFFVSIITLIITLIILYKL